MLADQIKGMIRDLPASGPEGSEKSNRIEGSRSGPIAAMERKGYRKSLTVFPKRGLDASG